MQESTFTNYDQLPLFLNANAVAQVLGVSSPVPTSSCTRRAFPRCGSATASWCQKKNSVSG